MKRFFYLLIALFTLGVSAQHVSPHISTVHITPHVSTVHSTPHVSVSHISEPSTIHVPHSFSSTHETPVYSPMKEIPTSNFKIHKNGMFYHLLLNHHTHKNDTITGATKEELKEKLSVLVKDKPKNNNRLLIIIFIGAVILAFIITVLNINQNKKINSQEE